MESRPGYLDSFLYVIDLANAFPKYLISLSEFELH